MSPLNYNPRIYPAAYPSQYLPQPKYGMEYDEESSSPARKMFMIGLVVIIIMLLILFVVWQHPYLNAVTFTPPPGAKNQRAELCGRIKSGDRFVVGDFIINNQGKLLLISEKDVTIHNSGGIVEFSLVRDTEYLKEISDPEIVDLKYNCSHVFKMSVNNKDNPTSEADEVTISTIEQIEQFISDSGAKSTCMFEADRSGQCA